MVRGILIPYNTFKPKPFYAIFKNTQGLDKFYFESLSVDEYCTVAQAGMLDQLVWS